MTAGSDNAFPKLITTVQSSDPSAPSNGDWKIYSKAGGIYARSSNSVVGPLGTAGTAGALVLLEQHTASASATLDFTTAISSTYDDYQIEFVNVIPATTAQNFLMRMGTGGGPTYDSGSNYKYNNLYNGSGDSLTGVDSTGTTQIIIAQSQSTQANYSLNGKMTLYNPGGAIYKATHSEVSSPVSTGSLYWWQGHGLYISTTAVTAFQFFYASGNIASGTIRVYGIAK